MKKQNTPHKNKTAARTNGAANGAKAAAISLPAEVTGYTRVPLYPLWWAEEQELHGAIVGVEPTVNAKGERVQALIVIAEIPNKGIDNWGDAFEVPKGEPLRIEIVPELEKVMPFGMHDEKQAPCIFHSLKDRGKRRYVVDLVVEGVLREGVTPAQQQGQGASPPS